MKILILGGTVYLSKTVAEQAMARGHEVTVAARGTSGEPPEGARFVKIDRAVPGGLAGVESESFDAVVDVSRIPGHVGPVLDALADRVGHWTFVSTCGVYERQDIPGQSVQTATLHEPAPIDNLKDDQYEKNKVACENLVTERVGDKAFILRAGLIVGTGDPMDRFGYWPQRISEGGEILAPGAPDERVQWIDVRDLASWILDAAEAGMTGTLDGAGKAVSRSEFLSEIAAALDVTPTFTWVPQDFLAEHKIEPWIGEPALGMWLPLPEYAGFLSRDTSASLAAGLKTRDLAETARDWLDWARARRLPPELAANLPREVENAVLEAWHDSDGS